MSEFGTALDQTPSNVNFLSPLVFKFANKKTPILDFYVQNINLPGVHLQQVEVGNPFVAIPKGGDHIVYDDLMINFKVNEDFTNWLEIYNWIKSMGFPKNFSQYDLTADTIPIGEGLTADISLIVMNSARQPAFNVKFRDAFPISVSSMIFDTTRTGVEYVDASATFRYSLYEIETVA
jgi:hypothetical protein